ncbi:MucB/RseB-like sigma(E) regulatory protein [Pseudomonas duriflava]|uniref:MucB/RseB-like sigma(E) regulatory protein n=1 Tax=Pseudomonas duriflava TaxID=459528 RepID=A0A562QPX6_9PSED|nr:MucB/RseB C-terminal domain-containing protein [Pseudomonas duriflava]TWI58784.1 MucB/RseB-like sigma(E) regulatory protein [Pseudomonas duriflava]
MRFAPVVCGMGGLFLIIQSVQAANGDNWLERVLSASKRISSQGIFVYVSNGQLTSHKVVRKVEKDGDSRERIYQLDGSPYEVIWENDQLLCNSRLEGNEVGFSKKLSRSLTARQIEQGYVVKHVGESRVADLPTDIIALVPKDQYRYAYEFHVGKQSGQILQSTTFDQKGDPVERLQYVSFSTAIPDNAALKPQQKCMPVNESNPVASDVPPSTWMVSWLPAGYELVRSQKSWAPRTGGHSVQYLLYSDGLSSFSVFVDPDSKGVVTDTRNQFGPTSVVSKRINPSNKDTLITVVGEIPLGAAERIALAVRPD